jgi:electron transport complex protein RnfD
MSDRFVVSASPHLHDSTNTARVMWWVVAALAPAAVSSVWIFGWRSLVVQAVSVAACLAAEVLSELALKRPITVGDGSAVVTGLLLAFTCPASSPWWMIVIGAAMAIFLVKQLFGGIGYNIFNPALAARALLLSSWPVAMTGWSEPVRSFLRADVVTAATPLGLMKEAARANTAFTPPGYLDLFLGNIPGSLGETCKAALLAGAALLLILKVVDWRTPVSFLAGMAALSALLGRNPAFDLLSGGAVLGAFFMATDPVTSPTTKTGRWIFGAACGLLSVLIRAYGGFPEGVCYAILFMNALNPMIEQYVRPRRFGARGLKKEAAQ